MPAPDLITAYAHNLNLAQRLQQQGRPVPQQLREQIAYVEQVASVQLDQSQIAQAMEHVNRIRLEDNEAHQQNFNEVKGRYDEIKQNAAFAKASNGLSPEGLPISPEQMAEAYNNKGKYTVKNAPKMNVEELDKHTRKKFGVSLEKFEDRQEHLLDVSLKGDDARTAELRKEYGISEAEQAAYKENGFEFHWAKHQHEKNASEPDEYEVQMSESAQRKNDIMMAAACEHGESVTDNDISDEYLNSDNDRQSDVARAFAEVENNEIADEVYSDMTGERNNG